MQIKLRAYLLLFALLLYFTELAFHFNSGTQISFLIFVLILFGVPHGALDLYIDQHINQNKANQSLFLLKYLANILLYALVWYFFPILALIIFILITSYHFGEIDWLGKANRPLHKLAYTLLGFAWILFLLTKNIHFALDVFLTMGRSAIQKAPLIELAATIYPYTLIILLTVYIVLFFFKDSFFNQEVYYYYSLAQTIVLILLYCTCHFGLVLPFTLAFGILYYLLTKSAYPLISPIR